MIDLLDEFYPDASGIVARVDEYALYCHYLGYDPWPGKPYHSPIRDEDDYDSTPSFAIFCLSKPKGDLEFTWKDYANGKHGDLFELVRQMMKLERRRDAICHVMDDIHSGLNLPLPHSVQRPPEFGEYKDIKVASRPFSNEELLYWLEIGVTHTQLSRYNTSAISKYWVNGKIRYGGPHTYAYRIGGNYQIYRPFAADRAHKFRHNFTLEQLPGFSQLPKTGPLLIIGKAYKETQAQDAWGFPSVNPRSENTPVSAKFLRHLEGRFDTVCTLFDNDGKHRKDYPYKNLYVPKSSGCKDPTEFARAYGVPEAITMVKDLIKTL